MYGIYMSCIMKFCSGKPCIWTPWPGTGQGILGISGRAIDMWGKMNPAPLVSPKMTSFLDSGDQQKWRKPEEMRVSIVMELPPKIMHSFRENPSKKNGWWHSGYPYSGKLKKSNKLMATTRWNEVSGPHTSSQLATSRLRLRRVSGQIEAENTTEGNL